MPPIAEPLETLLETYCDVNAPEMLDRLRDRIRAGEVPPDRVSAIRAALDEAITTLSVTPAQYKALTRDNECTTAEEVAERLHEVSGELFGRDTAVA